MEQNFQLTHEICRHLIEELVPRDNQNTSMLLTILNICYKSSGSFKILWAWLILNTQIINLKQKSNFFVYIILYTTHLGKSATLWSFIFYQACQKILFTWVRSCKIVNILLTCEVHWIEVQIYWYIIVFHNQLYLQHSVLWYKNSGLRLLYLSLLLEPREKKSFIFISTYL